MKSNQESEQPVNEDALGQMLALAVVMIILEFLANYLSTPDENEEKPCQG